MATYSKERRREVLAVRSTPARGNVGGAQVWLQRIVGAP